MFSGPTRFRITEFDCILYSFFFYLASCLNEKGKLQLTSLLHCILYMREVYVDGKRNVFIWLIWNYDFCIKTFKGRILFVRKSDQKIIEDQIMSIWATVFMANAIASTENKDLSRCIQMERNNERIGANPIKII